MLRIGLTGGVASGKSTVAAILAELGAGVVDTDVVAREVVAPGESGLEAVRKAFGDGLITPQGELDRRALRALVFADPGKRKRLEAILHPLIRKRTLAQVERLAAPYAVIVVPLLVETGFGELVDRVLVVDCPAEIQIARLIERDGIDRAAAAAMLAAQVDRETRVRAADDVVINDGTLESLRAQVERLHEHYLSLTPPAGVYQAPRPPSE